MATIRGIIFDLDNTLMDFGYLKRRAVEAAVKGMIETGMPISQDTAYQRIMEIYNDKGWEFQQVFDQFIIEKMGYLDYKFLAGGILAYRKAKDAEMRPYPHVYATLVCLIKRGIRLALVSDAPSREAWLRLCQLNLHHLFDAVITFDDTGRQKPDPAPFRRGLEKLGLSPEHTMMVGDWADRDIAGARQLGMVTVFARYGDIFNTEHPRSDYEMDRFDQLCNIVEKEDNRHD